MGHGSGRHWRLGTAAIVAVTLASPAAAQQRSFDVPAQSAELAIASIARQANIQIFAARKHTRGKRFNAVRGEMGVDQALEQLLKGTGLVARHSGGQTYTIVPLDGASAVEALGSSDGAQSGPELTESLEEQGTGQEIVVTGTNLRGVTPSSPVISVTRKAIERSGFQNSGDLIRSLPQSYGGGYNITIGNGGALGSSQSQSYMSTANLRGLGSDATLTLVDGYRLSAADFTNSVDISLIPLGAIERIEVLADGASAIYGSDAVAGVVNFILRKRYDGVQVTADLGLSSRGDGAQQTYSVLGGKSWGSGGALLNYEYSKWDEIEGGDRPFTGTSIAKTFLSPRQKRHSVFGQFSQDLASNVRVNVQGLWAKREIEDNIDFSRFGFQYGVDAKVKQYGLVGTLAFDLSDKWTVEVSGNTSRHSRADVAHLFGLEFPSNSRNKLHLGDVRVNGSLFELPGGSVQLAAGAGYRKEKLDQNALQADRNAKFAFGEVAVPLVSPDMALSGVDFLQLNAALRWEDYSDFGKTANPKLGVVYRPMSELTLKASWGKSFRAPSLTQVFSTGNAFLQYAPDPLSPTGQSLALITGGGNLELEPERARTLTLHAQYEPNWLPRARLQATYFNINYDGRIALPINNFALTFTDPIAAVFLTRSPSPELQAEAIAGRTFQNNSGAPYDPLTVVALLRNEFQNFVTDKVRGVDLIGQYSVPLAGGNLELNGNGTWLKDKRRAAPSLDAETITGRVYSPPKFRARAGATWIYGPFSVSGFLNHTASFKDVSTDPATKVDSWTTADFQLAFNGTEGALRGFSIAASVRNAFDEAPPELNSLLPAYTGFEFDSTNASGIGRYFSVRISKAF